MLYFLECMQRSESDAALRAIAKRRVVSGVPKISTLKHVMMTLADGCVDSALYAVMLRSNVTLQATRLHSKGLVTWIAYEGSR
jgi:hypothetical protein